VAAPAKKPATYEDLLALPDNVIGQIIDGELVTSPRPAVPHARAATILTGDLNGPFDRGILDAVKEKVAQAAKEIEDGWLQSAANTLVSISRIGNQYLNTKEPWNLMKTDKEKAGTVFYVTAQVVKAISVVSEPFMPQTAQQLYQTLNLPETVQQCRWTDACVPIEAGSKINKPQPLFHKVDTNEDVLDEQLAQVRAKRSSNT
jgi:methionyl-tRNA synthetase